MPSELPTDEELDEINKLVDVLFDPEDTHDKDEVINHISSAINNLIAKLKGEAVTEEPKPKRYAFEWLGEESGEYCVWDRVGGKLLQCVPSTRDARTEYSIGQLYNDDSSSYALQRHQVQFTAKDDNDANNVRERFLIELIRIDAERHSAVSGYDNYVLQSPVGKLIELIEGKDARLVPPRMVVLDLEA